MPQEKITGRKIKPVKIISAFLVITNVLYYICGKKYYF